MINYFSICLTLSLFIGIVIGVIISQSNEETN